MGVMDVNSKVITTLVITFNVNGEKIGMTIQLDFYQCGVYACKKLTNTTLTLNYGCMESVIFCMVHWYVVR